MRVRCSAVVGRESELAVLSDAVDRARAGVGSAVFLTGADNGPCTVLDPIWSSSARVRPGSGSRRARRIGTIP